MYLYKRLNLIYKHPKLEVTHTHTKSIEPFSTNSTFQDWHYHIQDWHCPKLDTFQDIIVQNWKSTRVVLCNYIVCLYTTNLLSVPNREDIEFASLAWSGCTVLTDALKLVPICCRLFSTQSITVIFMLVGSFCLLLLHGLVPSINC